MDLTNLISYWKLNGNGLDFTGTLNATEVSMVYGGGKNYLCGAFDASTRYLTIPYNAAQDLGNSASTLTAWINTSVSFAATSIIFDNIIYSASGSTAYRMAVTATNKAQFFIRDASSNSATLTSTNVVNTGSWTHIACTDDGTTAKMYINGVLDVSTSSSSVGVINTGSAIQIGRYVRDNQPSGAQYFSGKIDDITYWKRALTAAEVLEMYQQISFPFQDSSNFFKSI